MLKTYGDVENKFKFVLMASKRAKQLLRGEKPKIKSKSKSLIRIAQEEVRKGLVEYEIVQKKGEEEYRAEEEGFIGFETGEKEEAIEKETGTESKEKREEKIKSESKKKKKPPKKKKQEKS